LVHCCFGKQTNRHNSQLYTVSSAYRQQTALKILLEIFDVPKAVTSAKTKRSKNDAAYVVLTGEKNPENLLFQVYFSCK